MYLNLGDNWISLDTLQNLSHLIMTEVHRSKRPRANRFAMFHESDQLGEDARIVHTCTIEIQPKDEQVALHIAKQCVDFSRIQALVEYVHCT